MQKKVKREEKEKKSNPLQGQEGCQDQQKKRTLVDKATSWSEKGLGSRKCQIFSLSLT